MNYAVVILTFVLLFALVYWFVHGKDYYTGPRTHAHIDHGVIVNDESDSPNDKERGPEPVAVA